MDQQTIPLTVRCGNDQLLLSSTTIATTTSSMQTTIMTTNAAVRGSDPTVSLIQPSIDEEDIPSSISKEHIVVPDINPEQSLTTIESKTSSFDPSMK